MLAVQKKTSAYCTGQVSGCGCYLYLLFTLFEVLMTWFFNRTPFTTKLHIERFLHFTTELHSQWDMRDLTSSINQWAS